MGYPGRKETAARFLNSYAKYANYAKFARVRPTHDRRPRATAIAPAGAGWMLPSSNLAQKLRGTGRFPQDPRVGRCEAGAPPPREAGRLGSRLGPVLWPRTG